MQVTFSAKDGRNYTLKADENGKVFYTDVPDGQYDVEFLGEEGQTLTWYQVTIGKESPTEPEPTEPTDNSDDLDTPFEEPGETGQSEENQKKGNAGLIVGVTFLLIALAAGAVTVIIILKKKKKNKEQKGD